MHREVFFFFNDTATTEIYTLSLHDALPIFCTYERSSASGRLWRSGIRTWNVVPTPGAVSKLMFPPCVSSTISRLIDRKSTRLNSSHANISYAVFCLKKKNHYHISHDNSLLL